MSSLTKQIFFTFFNTTNHKTKTIIITPFSHLINYTFLAIKAQILSPEFQQKVKKTQFSKLIQLLQMLGSHKLMFQAIKAEDFGHVDLQEMQQGKIIKNKALNSHYAEILRVKGLFADMRKQIVHFINKKTVLQWLQICTALQIVDIQIWNNLISSSLAIYQQSSIRQRLYILTAINHYIKHKYTSYTFLPSKFVYSQAFLLDIVPLKPFLKNILEDIHKVQESDDQAAFTSILIQMVQKMSKTSHVNFMEYILLVKNNLASLLNIIKKGNLQTVLNLYKFVSIIGLYDQKIMTIIQQRIIQILNNKVLYFEERINLLNKLLSIWSILNHHNNYLYNKYLKKYIEQYMESGSAIRCRSIWIHNILSSGIKDDSIIKQLQQQIQIDLPMGNKYIHIALHYLSVIENRKGLSSYPICAQHPIILKTILKNRKVYLNCMQRQAKNGKKLSIKSFIQNSVQDFWLKMLQRAFLILSQQFPSENNQIFLNFQFCVFELDALMILNNKPIAFELIGNHYMLKNLQNEYINKKHGKKVLKSKIIEAYGIQLLQIRAGNIIQRTISSFHQTQKGVYYLCKLITDIVNKAS